MRAFVTGGTGFIGQRLVRLLVQQGHDVRALAGSRSDEQTLQRFGATPVPGDVTDRVSLESGMKGCDTVIHAANHALAATIDHWQAQTQIIAGTRNTLSAAHDLGITHILFLSHVTVLGDTRGQLVDETYIPAQAPPGEIGRALWRAHYEVAMPLVEQGAPIITVMPGEVYGPGDTGWVTELMRRFYRGSLPVVPAPETTLTYAFVDDIARGCILAAQKGKSGETYCLTGPAVPLGELVEFWSRLTGRKAPAISLSIRTLQSMVPMLDAVVDSNLATYLGGTYIARSDKARTELGWSTQPMQTTTLETFEWIAATEPADKWEKRRHSSALVLSGLIGMLVLWLLLRRGKDEQTED